MCLSTVYKGAVAPENLLLSNVQKIESKDGTIVLTDLMEREVAIEGQLVMANLVDGVVIIAPAA